MSAARVVLRGAESYKLGGHSWVKNVPRVIKDEKLIQSLEQNAYFLVKRLQPKSKSTATTSAPSEKEGQGRKLVKRALPEESKEE